MVDLSAGFSARQAEGLGEMADGNLQGAHDTSTAAEHDRPGYRETSAPLEQAKQHVTETRWPTSSASSMWLPRPKSSNEP